MPVNDHAMVSVYSLLYESYVKQWNVDLTLLNITSTTYVLGDCILSKTVPRCELTMERVSSVTD